ncbi:MAG: WxcM-like domain-containing protein [Bacteroidales bacterium]|nr:WxcM-like domain-containing protein [Bacteroidales bacterium]
MINQTSIDDCRIIKLGKIHNRAGNITVIEKNELVQFDVKRIYYLYDIPGGSERGGHAHKALYQLLVAASGSFNVLLNDGRKEKVIALNQPNIGLIIVPGIWRELMNFSSGAICLVLASTKYSEKDYLRGLNDFKKHKHNG